MTPRPSRHRTRRYRAGYTVLEAQVAFVVLGVALAGICPLVVMQLRVVRKLEARFPAGTYYLAPAPDGWARKLGVPAAIVSTDPGTPSNVATASPANAVTLVAPGVVVGADDATITVHVSTGGS
ncbi:MAG TPA: hypothetical protein VG406_15070 [Isosphaeraceae bacterium]|jgi:hypothetical protein|nr:hypothetical protein [Isosphaeraceae bacterium]